MDSKHVVIQNQNEETLNSWREKEKKALELMQIVGELRFDKSIELVLFRRDIYDTRPSDIINIHPFVSNYSDQPISVDTSLALAKTIASIENFAPARLDIGKLGAEWVKEQANYTDVNQFINDKCGEFIGADKKRTNSKDVVLYGFGRIGRLAARRIISTTGRGEQLRLKAIVVRPKMKDVGEEMAKRAALLSEDTVHGKFQGTIDINADKQELIINGNTVKMIFAKKPEDIDYTEYGINDALVIDNTGVWRDKEALSVHLRPGASQVMLTAPGQGIPNIVYGVNHQDMDIAANPIMCAASCTTNAIVPIIKVLDDKYTITKGHIETIHAYTSDQNLLDNFHKKPRRGRGAATNMVLTTTGAAKAVSKVIPHLAGKLTGNAVRVPTPNVSLAIMNLTFEKPTNRDEVHDLLREACLYGNLVEQIHYSNSTEYVSSQAVGMTSTSVLDAPSIIVSPDGLTATVYAWYDNEYGYTCQVVRLAKHVAKVRRYYYY